jgi:hypothetical protein
MKALIILVAAIAFLCGFFVARYPDLQSNRLPLGSHSASPALDTNAANSGVGLLGVTDSLGEAVLSANDLVLFARIQDGYELGIRQFDRNPTTGAFEGETEILQSTSYRIHDVCARQSSELYVAGYTQGGELILERWTLAEPAGIRFFHLAVSMLPPGTPLSPLPVIQQGISGDGSYMAVALRAPSRRVQRSELLRVSSSGPPSWVMADPERRFLLYSVGSPAVVRQWYFDGSSVDLCSEQAVPVLKQLISLGLAQHATLGRLLVLEASSDLPGSTGEPVHIIFSDQENTGVFGPVQILTQSQWIQQGFEEAVWYRPALTVWDTE